MNEPGYRVGGLFDLSLRTPEARTSWRSCNREIQILVHIAWWGAFRSVDVHIRDGLEV